MGISWLDVQPGMRVLIRYKGLTLAGGLAVAVAIGLGAGWYDVMRDRLHPALPLPDGDAIGQTLQLGRARLTVVGVMPDGFAFPETHTLWVPQPLPSSGYAPLEGPAVHVFGRLAPGMQPAQVAEIVTLTSRVAAASVKET